MTELQKQYKKELRRIKRFLKRATERGYAFPASVIPKEPKTITKKSVERLQKIDPQSLYKKSIFHDPISGQTFKGEKARKMERSRASKKAAKTRAERVKSGYYERKQSEGFKDVVITDYPAEKYDEILKNIEELIDAWNPHGEWTDRLTDAKEKDVRTLKSILNGAIASLGREVVAENVQKYAAIITELVVEIMYASGSIEGNFRDSDTKVNHDLTQITEILWGRAITVEEAKSINKLSELYETEDYIDAYTIDSIFKP